MCVIYRRRRRFLLLILFVLIASCSLIVLVLRSSRSRASNRQRFQIQFLNEHYLYDVSTPRDPGVCDNKTLFIGVLSRPESFEKRNSIRRSWGAGMPDNVIMRFFVGRTESSTYVKLMEEEGRFGDVVFYDLPDGYDKLHLKVHTIMQWQQTFCAQAPFWLKTDDDTTVHVARLLHHIERRFKPAMDGTKAIFCFVKPTIEVHRDRGHKWYVPRELFPDDVYPPFCSGFSYLVSSDAVAAILSGTHSVKAYHNEDTLYTGVIAGKVGVQKSSQTDVFHKARLLQNVTKCDGTGVPLTSAMLIHDGDPTQLQVDTLSLMKNQRCA